jgi:hypothetical protein
MRVGGGELAAAVARREAGREGPLLRAPRFGGSEDSAAATASPWGTAPQGLVHWVTERPHPSPSRCSGCGVGYIGRSKARWT